MKKASSTTILILSLLVFVLAQPSWAYQEVEVTNGGTIQGRAILDGEIPSPRYYHLVLFPNLDLCAEIDTDEEMNRVLDDFKIDDKNGLRDVVVTLEHVEAGKPFETQPINIVSENCKFSPDVSIVRQGATFFVDNRDAVMHNSQVYQKERGKIILNIPIPAEEISDGKVTFQKHYKIHQFATKSTQTATMPGGSESRQAKEELICWPNTKARRWCFTPWPT